MSADKIKDDELIAWGQHLRAYLLDILNGDYDLEQARDDIRGFRGTKYYTGSEEKYLTNLNQTDTP